LRLFLKNIIFSPGQSHQIDSEGHFVMNPTCEEGGGEGEGRGGVLGRGKMADVGEIERVAEGMVVSE
jgi:hypothetical protein